MVATVNGYQGDTFALQVALALRFDKSSWCQFSVVQMLFGGYLFADGGCPTPFALIVSSFTLLKRFLCVTNLPWLTLCIFFLKGSLSGTPLSYQMFLTRKEVEKPIESLIRNHSHLRYHTETELSFQPFMWTNAMMMCLPFSFKTFDQKSKVSHSECHVCVLTSFSASKLQCLWVDLFDTERLKENINN